MVIASYFLVKFMIRPAILESGRAGIFKVFVLSYPNFCEAVAGTIVVAFLLLLFSGRLCKETKEIEKYIALIATGLSGAYVILQELKIHNIGGVNVYDPYDVLFSVVGLIVAFCLLRYTKPKYIAGRR